MPTPRLHSDTIEEVKTRSDIVDVVSDYVILRKRGKDFVGLCPFHNEKSPSFTVSPSKQMYYCFGCQTAGSSIKFLMEVGKQSFSEVVLDLAKRYQVPVKTLEPERRQELERQISLRGQLYEVLASAANFYQHSLKAPIGEKAMSYLRERRQFKPDTIEQFGLGYAPAGWQTLYRHLVDNKHYPPQIVEQAGLIKPRKEGGGYYDVFRDRLMIPIRDTQGRVIAFGGRTLTDEQPKYLNSPETELFGKGKTLFAIDQAKDEISKSDQAVIVEGYFDAIALHAVGINNAVASLGTALSLDQVKLVLRYTESNKLILNFDADKSGIDATERAIGGLATLSYRGEIQLKILNIPDGKDADEYLRVHTTQDYKKLLADAPLWIDWQIQRIVENKDLRKASDFQQTAKRMVALLKNIVNPDTLNYYISYCAEILSLGEAKFVPLRVENLLNQVLGKENGDIPNSPGIQKERTLLELSEILLLQIYLHCSDQRKFITEELEARNIEFSLSHHRNLWRIISEFTENTPDLVSKLQDKYLEMGEDIELVSHIFYLNEKNRKDILRSQQVIQTALVCIEMVFREKRCERFLELLEKADSSTRQEMVELYYQSFLEERCKLEKLNQQRIFSVDNLF